jgi:uncharacterized glyoxalase superfamily protein PhnB
MDETNRILDRFDVSWMIYVVPITRGWLATNRNAQPALILDFYQRSFGWSGGNRHNKTNMQTINRVIPVLVYEDIPAAHDFLIEAFGFTSGGIHRTPDGNADHAEVRAGDFAIWLHRVTAEYQMSSPRSWPASSAGLVVHVEDVAAHFERARSCGARVESEPRDMPYGLRDRGGDSRMRESRWKDRDSCDKFSQS